MENIHNIVMSLSKETKKKKERGGGRGRWQVMAVHAHNKLLIGGTLVIHVMDVLCSPTTAAEYKSTCSIRDEEVLKLNVKVNTGLELNLPVMGAAAFLRRVSAGPERLSAKSLPPSAA